MLRQRQMESWAPYVHFGATFTDPECDQIIALADTLPMAEARVGGDQVVETIRRSKTGWVAWSEANGWIFDRLSAISESVRENWYPFALTGFVEPLQLTAYDAEHRGHYAMHRDMGPLQMSTRKLSMVTLLSDPQSYEGGELELLSIDGEAKAVPETARGTVIVFPAWEMHRVLPVTSGKRWSLVAWVHGPRFT